MIIMLSAAITLVMVLVLILPTLVLVLSLVVLLTLLPSVSHTWSQLSRFWAGQGAYLGNLHREPCQVSCLWMWLTADHEVFINEICRLSAIALRGIRENTQPAGDCRDYSTRVMKRTTVQPTPSLFPHSITLQQWWQPYIFSTRRLSSTICLTMTTISRFWEWTRPPGACTATAIYITVAYENENQHDRNQNVGYLACHKF